MPTKRPHLLFIAALISLLALLGTAPIAAQAPIKKHEATKKTNQKPTPTPKKKKTKQQTNQTSRNDAPVSTTKSVATPAPDCVTTMGDGSLFVSVENVSFNMVKVSGGTFTMGANADDDEAYEWEIPRHQVTLSDYYIGQTEVTQALWKAVMGTNPSDFVGDNLPVERVSWYDCQKFINKLNAMTGQTFSLPTEAEWEFAARGGIKTQGYKYSGRKRAKDVSWYDDNSDSKTHIVGTKKPNELGIYDMSGNVWEWCSDWFSNYSSNSKQNPTGPSSGTGRVERGGSWNNTAFYSRISYRYNSPPTKSHSTLGLRLALHKVR